MAAGGGCSPPTHPHLCSPLPARPACQRPARGRPPAAGAREETTPRLAGGAPPPRALGPHVAAPVAAATTIAAQRRWAGWRCRHKGGRAVVNAMLTAQDPALPPPPPPHRARHLPTSLSSLRRQTSLLPPPTQQPHAPLFAPFPPPQGHLRYAGRPQKSARAARR